MPEISKQVRDVVLARLADSTQGFNVHLAAAAASYGISGFTIDWAPGSKNFFVGQYSAEEILGSSAVRLPAMTLFTVSSVNRNRQKFQTFSGDVVLGLDFWLAWRGQNTVNTESLADAVEEAMYACLNSGEWNAVNGPVCWNGEIQLTRRPVNAGAQGWIQALTFRAPFELDVR